MRLNHLKNLIRSGKPAFGVSLQFPSTDIVEIIGILGFDWILLDAEHGSISPENVKSLIMAAQLHDITPIVRPENNQASTINKYLDLGAMGIQAPHINNGKDAQNIVNSCLFQPSGHRSLGGGKMSDFGIGQSTEEFTEGSNDRTLICVQIEDMLAVKNLEEILSVEGIDVFFVGPTDLSQSMGCPGGTKHPTAKKAIYSLLKRISESGRTPGFPGSANEITEIVEAGVLYNYTHVSAFFSEYGKQFLKLARSD